jgi:hypothetical protein
MLPFAMKRWRIPRRNAPFCFMPISRELLEALRAECLRLMAENPIDRDALMTVAEFYFAVLARRSRSASAIN